MSQAHGPHPDPLADPAPTVGLAAIRGSASASPLPARGCLEETTEPLFGTRFCSHCPNLPAAVSHLPPHQPTLLLLLPSSWKPEARIPRPRVTAPQQRLLSRCRWDGVVPRAPSSPLSMHNAGRRVLGVAPSPGGHPVPAVLVGSRLRPPRCPLPFTFRRSGDRVHGLLSATGRRWIKEGARAHSCCCCGMEMGSAVPEDPHTPRWVPKCHSA